MEALFEKELIALESIYVLHGVMSKMCKNWTSQLERQ